MPSVNSRWQYTPSNRVTGAVLQLLVGTKKHHNFEILSNSKFFVLPADSTFQCQCVTKDKMFLKSELE